MPRKKREPNEPSRRVLAMPDWLSAKVEEIAAVTGMTQQKVTQILQVLVFPRELAEALPQRVHEHLGQLLIPGYEAQRIVPIPPAEAGLAAEWRYRQQQAAEFGIDPADVVVPDEIPAVEEIPIDGAPF